MNAIWKVVVSRHMKYISTRGGESQSFLKILLEGLASDGGLYVPQEYPLLTKTELAAMRKMTYPELAYAVLAKFIDDIPKDDIQKFEKGLRLFVSSSHPEIVQTIEKEKVLSPATEKMLADAITQYKEIARANAT